MWLGHEYWLMRVIYPQEDLWDSKGVTVFFVFGLKQNTIEV